MTKKIMELVQGDDVMKEWVDELIQRNAESLKGSGDAERVLDQATRRSEFLQRLRLELEVGP